MKSLAVAAFMIGLALPAGAGELTPICNVPLDLVRMTHPLAHVAQKIASQQPITIVAIGSSSTAGAGASTPAANYPNRLAVELKQLFPKNQVEVINRGVNGEEIADMLKRFDSAVIDVKPDLVLWQLGTNSIIRDHSLAEQQGLIHDGIVKIRATGADVVLIDPQFAPKVIAKMHAAQAVELIATTAKREDVDLFRRYDVMKRWRDVDHIPFEVSVALDGLHLNDWSYACMAKSLGLAIAEAAQRPVMSATAMSYMVP